MTTAAHNRALGDKPWAIIEPHARARTVPPHVPDTALEESGFWWWIEGSAGNWHVMYAGGAAGPQEAQNTEYPDRIWDRLRSLDPTLPK